MRKGLKLPLLLALLSLGAAPAFAQASASQSTTGTTKIDQPITLTKNSDLAFGTLVRSTSASNNTVTIDPTSGVRSISGSGDGALAPSTTSRAAFTVGGEGGQTFSVTVPATFAMTSSSNSITVTLSTTGASGTLSNSLGTSGSATIGVGGSFTVNNTQASGAYSGTFTTTVAYN